MNKLEAADKLAEAVEKLLSDNPYLCAYCHQKNYEHSQGCAKQVTMKLLEGYHQAPAIPPLEPILAAMEFFADPKLLDSTFPELQTRDRISRKTLAELRKAVGK